MAGWIAKLGATTAEELIDRSIERLIGHGIDPAQRRGLVAMLADVKRLDRPSPLTATEQDAVRGAIHLILSTAEYQLC